MCLYNKLIDNAKYKKNKKNAGIIPAFSDNRVLVVPIGCGECIECRKQKAREWQVRLLEDIRHNRNGIFVTLTFSNESIKEINSKIGDTYTNRKGELKPLEGYKRDNAIAKYAVAHFRERWRKETTKSPRHWLVTELGHQGTENIHLHGIIWTDTPHNIKKHWKYGFVWDGYKTLGKKTNYVSTRTVNYIMKYITKMDKQHPHFMGRILTSPGVGKDYIEKNQQWKNNKYKGEDTKQTYTTATGHTIAMPVYWRNKIYSEEEREKLWLIQLDRAERWVCGERVDISQGQEEYIKLVQYYRKRNTRLGYGNSYKDWNQIDYENMRRKAMLDKRIRNTNTGQATTAQIR